MHAMRSYRARHSNPSLTALGNIFSFEGLFEALMALVCILLPFICITRDGCHGIFADLKRIIILIALVIYLGLERCVPSDE